MLQTTIQGGRTDRPGERAGLAVQPGGGLPMHRNGNNQQGLAGGLGWFSLGLGLSQLLAPRGLAKMIGVRADGRTRDTMLAIGLRELASGYGILTRRRRAPWLWMRVGGDLMDLALLGRAASKKRRRTSLLGVGIALTAVAGVTVLDLLAAGRQTRLATKGRTNDRAQQTTAFVTIDRSPEEIYRFWRDVSNLPQFMVHLDSVTTLDERRSHWVAKGPLDARVEWDAEIVDDRPFESIAWRSSEDSELHTAGVVYFRRAPGGRGTEVTVDMSYDPPGGQLGVAFAKLLGKEPGQQIKGDLRRLKQVLETGEIVHSDASIHRGMHPARPATDAELMEIEEASR